MGRAFDKTLTENQSLPRAVKQFDGPRHFPFTRWPRQLLHHHTRRLQRPPESTLRTESHQYPARIKQVGHAAHHRFIPKRWLGLRAERIVENHIEARWQVQFLQFASYFLQGEIGRYRPTFAPRRRMDLLEKRFAIRQWKLVGIVQLQGKIQWQRVRLDRRVADFQAQLLRLHQRQPSIQPCAEAHLQDADFSKGSRLVPQPMLDEHVQRLLHRPVLGVVAAAVLLGVERVRAIGGLDDL